MAKQAVADRGEREVPKVGVWVEAIGPHAEIGYEIFAGRGEPKAIGRVIKVRKESHIRRGRAQVAPWWRPLNLAGVAIGERTRHGEVVDYQTRLAAINRLLDYCELPRQVAPSGVGGTDG